MEKIAKLEVANMEKIAKIENLHNFMKETIKTQIGVDLDNADYKKLNKKKSEYARDLYSKCVNKLQLDPNKPLYSIDGQLLANKFDRIVIGDYGAYIEYDLKDVPEGVTYSLAKGEEYRVQPYWRNRVKYIWYTDLIGNIKIYWQLKTVSYADYKVKKFYISPYEVIQKEA